MKDYALRLDYKQQKEWSKAPMWLEITFGEVGGALFLISVWLQFALGVIVGVLVLVVGKGILLMGDLGKPERFLRVMARPGSSWISKGAWGFLLFTVTGVLTAAPLVITALPWTPWSGGGRVLGIIACVLAVFMMVYDGFFLANSKGVGFWHDGSLPILFGASATLGGLGAVAILALATGFQLPMDSLAMANAAAAAGAAFCTYSILTTAKSKGTGSEVSSGLIKKGPLTGTFYFGAVVVGMAVPFVCGLLGVFGMALPMAAWAACGVLAIIGVILLRSCILRAGVYTPAR